MKRKRWIIFIGAFVLAMLIGSLINLIMYGISFRDRWPSHVLISTSFAIVMTFVSPAIEARRKS
ncbi:hypothetical protein MM326_18740 [Alkalihalobacillus sp. LMS6]|uniref:hypothetical protein n=1 Tax=Alkalihalobacillus sp. LMS6 TaxID=2924034 RepID=UPI0020D15229|nr:hypothetical protein [Alkalihalobacillus sp. LMS6]UTR06091.1 hypothetical protein MM326_18740 [Alkalihalobacillus sp. LMS6]